MTGVAAIMSGRDAVLSDLSAGSVHLSRNHTRPVEPERLSAAVNGLDRRWMVAAENRLYSADLDDGQSGLTRHTIWSEVYPCPGCSKPVVLWEVSNPDRALPREIQCPACRQDFSRTLVAPIGSIPVEVVLKPSDGGKLVRGAPSEATLDHLDRLARQRNRWWVPKTPVEANREMYIRSALQLRGIRTVADFFAPRPKLALGRLWHEIGRIPESDLREAMAFAFTNTAWHSSRMRRFNSRGGQRPLTGTLFIPQLISEPNVFEVFRHQVAQIGTYYNQLPDVVGSAAVHRGSATDLSWQPDASVDYVFTDPPFGANLFYADCNIVWEAWLGQVTDHDAEIVVNKSRRPEQGGKSVDDYQRLLTDAFRETRRIVRPDGRVSVVFHNSDDRVWSALLQATEDAGLRQAEVTILDKGQRSQKGYKARVGELVPFYDLVMTFVRSGRTVAHLNGAGEIAIDAVRRHLGAADGVPPAQRALDFLYSVAVAEVVRGGQRPSGLSLRAFEQLCNQELIRTGDQFSLR